MQGRFVPVEIPLELFAEVDNCEFERSSRNRVLFPKHKSSAIDIVFPRLLVLAVFCLLGDGSFRQQHLKHNRHKLEIVAPYDRVIIGSNCVYNSNNCTRNPPFQCNELTVKYFNDGLPYRLAASY
jgi:hypothetical protein